MNRTPSRKLFQGRLINVQTTLPDLLRYPAGSCCLYQTPEPYRFESGAYSMANRAGGHIIIEPLFAVDLKTDEIFDLARVVVSRSCDEPKQYRAATVNFCAPPRVLVRCRAGTSALYEDIEEAERNSTASKYLNKMFRQAGAKGVHYKCHLIDIRRGITKPIHYAEVIKRGLPYKLLPKIAQAYIEFM